MAIILDHVYCLEPIDYWDNAEPAESIIADEVLRLMPEEPRDDRVYKLVIPTPPCLREIYLCKADNNGTVYIFSDFDITSFTDYLEKL